MAGRKSGNLQRNLVGAHTVASSVPCGKGAVRAGLGSGPRGCNLPMRPNLSSEIPSCPSRTTAGTRRPPRGTNTAASHRRPNMAGASGGMRNHGGQNLRVQPAASLGPPPAPADQSDLHLPQGSCPAGDAGPTLPNSEDIVSVTQRRPARRDSLPSQDQRILRESRRLCDPFDPAAAGIRGGQGRGDGEVYLAALIVIASAMLLGVLMLILNFFQSGFE